jgi:hypothetical protein
MISSTLDKNLVTLSVLGEFTVADFKQFEEQVLFGIQFEGPVNLLIDLRDMVGYSIDVVWEELKFSRQHQYEFIKVAVVTSNQWLTWSTWLQRLFVDADIEVFDDFDTAKGWIVNEA